jgi:hypothetical protein
MTSTNASETLKNTSQFLQQTITGFADLLEQSTQLGLDLFDALSGGVSQLSGSSIDLSSLKAPWLQGCGCKIPPPCWLPRSAGHVISHVCPGSSATLRIRITNCGHLPRTISFEDAAKNLVTFKPSTLTLGPFESGEVHATLAAPSSECEQSALIWIRGCKEYYVRWTIRTVKRGATCSCHEISIEDCPDFLHHWYDHFYCPRPCPSHAQKR